MSATTEVNQQKIVNLRSLKQFATENLRENSVLREVLFAEKDEMSPTEFLAKMQTWLFLLRRREE
jgi:hypothetical protein